MRELLLAAPKPSDYGDNLDNFDSPKFIADYIIWLNRVSEYLSLTSPAPVSSWSKL